MQVKSLKKAKKLAAALSIIEKECGIRDIEIIIDNLFVSPDIDLAKLNNGNMEKLLNAYITISKNFGYNK